jgi:saccharopine dehydrogenase-like NADP-dependent oxidoreductase
MNYRILIVGGYGTFGERICRALAMERDKTLFIAGRDRERATSLANELGPNCQGVVLDHQDSNLATAIRSLWPSLVIHTAGPFQAQDYHVAEAALDAGAHYVDLADGRDFVRDIAKLDARARARGLVVTSGASTLPAVSSAVVEHFAKDFRELTRIEIGIAPAQAIPRGLATMASVLSYCGRPFLELENGEWRTVRGWLGLRRIHHPDLGTRWAARCDVPDLSLLPKRYPSLRSVRFDAALELAAAQFGMAFLASMTRVGVLRQPQDLASMLLRTVRRLDRFGTDVGGMYLRIDGTSLSGRPQRRAWYLAARQGHGPQIPCIPAIVIARKLARGERIASGARPCMGMMTLEEFTAATEGFNILWNISEGDA